MKVFFDCEFTGLHKETTLISIGLVSASGKHFYAELNDYNEYFVDGWIRDNVVNHLWHGVGVPEGVTYVSGDGSEVADALREWFGTLDAPVITMVGDVLAYDWVLFCDLFGGPLNFPFKVYYIPLDLATLLWTGGYDPDVNREIFAGNSLESHKHNALWDAQQIRACYNIIAAQGVVRGGI